MATLALLSNGILQDTFIYPALFLAGVISKVIHHNITEQPKSPTSETLDTLTKDYAAMRELYTTAKQELDRRVLLESQKEHQVIELRARLKSYENFFQSRTLQMDQAVKTIPVFLEAIAKQLNISIPEEQLEGYEAAHSQAKTL